jgi:hypothetical protein
MSLRSRGIRLGTAFVILASAFWVSGGTAMADCPLQPSPLRQVADARGTTFTGKVVSIGSSDRGAGWKRVRVAVKHPYAGRPGDVVRLVTPVCQSIATGEPPLQVGRRYFISAAKPGDARSSNTIIYRRTEAGTWKLVELQGEPPAFEATMTLGRLLDLTVPNQAAAATTSGLGAVPLLLQRLATSVREIVRDIGAMPL